jgi:hypothetical protein
MTDKFKKEMAQTKLPEVCFSFNVIDVAVAIVES